MKRIHSLIIAFLAAFAAVVLMTVSASAAETLQYGDLSYKIDGADLEITGYTGNDSYVYIPDQIDGRDVTIVGGFQSTNVSKVRLPNKLRELKTWAFRDCTNLETIVLPNSLEYLGGAFLGCTNLTEIVFGQNISSFSTYYTFMDCENLSIISLPESFTTCLSSEQTFRGCNNLCDVYIRSYLQSWYDCWYLDSVNLICTTEEDAKKTYIKYMSEANIEVIPFEKSHAKVTFDSNGGDTPNTEIWTLRGQSVSEEIPPQKTDCEFVGWYDNKNCTGSPWDFIEDKVSSNITLYAKWRPLQFEVTFDAQGGNCPVNKQNYSFGMAMGSLPIPTKTNYQFIGWYTRPDGNGDLYTESTIMPRSDIKLYACWLQEGKSLIVEYNANGGECDKAKSLVEYNKAISDMPTPKLTGSKFLDWNTMPDGSGDYYTSTTPVKNLNLILYAVWDIERYTITLNPNGGNVSNITKSVRYNSKIGTIEQPKRDGYEFLGWFYDDGIQFKTSDKMPSEDITLKAKWRGFEYMILFDARSGKCDTEIKTVCCGDSVGELPVPTRKKYQFIGWYTKTSGRGILFTSDTEMPEKDITLYACWKKVSGYASSVKLDTSKITLGVGQVYTASAVTNPVYTLDKFTWKSSNTKVATVNSSGMIIAKAKGTATITVTTTKGKSAKLSVTVKKAVTSIKTSYTSRTLKVGQEASVKATPTGYAGTLKWSSSNPNIVSVDDKGNIKALRKGSVTITVKAYNGVYVQVKITVE